MQSAITLVIKHCDHGDINASLGYLLANSTIYDENTIAARGILKQILRIG